MNDLQLEWSSAGTTVGAKLGEGYALLATAIGTIRHHGVDAPHPDTLEGVLHAVPEARYVIDARRLAAIIGDAQLTRASPRGSATLPWTQLTSRATTNRIRPGTPHQVSVSLQSRSPEPRVHPCWSVYHDVTGFWLTSFKRFVHP